jgi:hypothetical protein
MDASSKLPYPSTPLRYVPTPLSDLPYPAMHHTTRWFDLPSPALDQSAPHDRLAQSGARSTCIHSRGDKDEGINVMNVIVSFVSCPCFTFPLMPN